VRPEEFATRGGAGEGAPRGTSSDELRAASSSRRRMQWNGLYSIALVDFASSRSTNFWILPVEVFGSSWNTNVLGTL
jgi:hypothetical protein